MKEYETFRSLVPMHHLVKAIGGVVVQLQIFFYSGTRWTWMLNCTPQSFYLWRKSPGITGPQSPSAYRGEGIYIYPCPMPWITIQYVSNIFESESPLLTYILMSLEFTRLYFQYTTDGNPSLVDSHLRDVCCSYLCAVCGSWRRVQSVCGPRHGTLPLYGQRELNELLASISTHSVPTGGPSAAQRSGLPSILTSSYRWVEEKEMLLCHGVIDGKVELLQTVANVRTGQQSSDISEMRLLEWNGFRPAAAQYCRTRWRRLWLFIGAKKKERAEILPQSIQCLKYH
jgi:hypothetical protein